MILLENGPRGEPALFDSPRRLIRADTAGEVEAALAALDAARAEGVWLAGYARYELGHALEPKLARLMPEQTDGPLLHFGVYDAPTSAQDILMRATAEAGGATIGRATPAWGAAEHAQALGRVQDYIAAGDVYQVNLTMQMRAPVTGTPLGLYGALRQRQTVAHGAFVDLPEAPVILSRSPELFFATDARGRIETHPMKGTAPRATNPAHDAALKLGLQESVKNRAENLMIVDLLRNDISRIAEVGSVRVPALFAIESYATVHQMVSHVTGTLLPGTTPSGIFRALFPCGSITGAPKIRAMEIIHELEAGPRGIYCGAIGWIGPDGSSAFNVAIRTMTLAGDEVGFGVGGGIVIDSTAEGEWEEALWKARFADLTPA
ncbi:aminodeoxychorismate synthase component I [Defluviimonas sp. WL0075]|uniref:Aminodeoxychorismate synthase component I n=1 Tax=Albidovulum sediminicola TaxID=2984331 RepID=A0ABT2Z340_9RHOB|nr:aminodeoxychorismate synthase component I [Defluviimonas sp. WL0075]MCV2865201.1 aminodeoxychorismate synthase component I [Defluviimonas sp. WL0075]